MKNLFILTFITLFIALAATSCVSKSETTTTDSTTVDSAATDSIATDTAVVK
jgi:hypothetical protein